MALVAALVTALVEAAPSDLDDNLIVPLTAAGVLYLTGLLT
jgi:dolichol kinase